MGSDQRGGKYTERDWYWKDWTARGEGNEVEGIGSGMGTSTRDGVVRRKGKKGKGKGKGLKGSRMKVIRGVGYRGESGGGRMRTVVREGGMEGCVGGSEGE